jgi:hypothetical protein
MPASADAGLIRSPEQETIVHCFSARLYGLRKYRKKLRRRWRGFEVILAH